MAEIRQTRVDETFRLSTRGEAQRVMRVTYFVGEQGPFTNDYTAAEFVPERVKKDQREMQAKLEALGLTE